MIYRSLGNTDIQHKKKKPSMVSPKMIGVFCFSDKNRTVQFPPPGHEIPLFPHLGPWACPSSEIGPRGRTVSHRRCRISLALAAFPMSLLCDFSMTPAWKLVPTEAQGADGSALLQAGQLVCAGRTAAQQPPAVRDGGDLRAI